MNVPSQSGADPEVSDEQLAAPRRPPPWRPRLELTINPLRWFAVFVRAISYIIDDGVKREAIRLLAQLAASAGFAAEMKQSVSLVSEL